MTLAEANSRHDDLAASMNAAGVVWMISRGVTPVPVALCAVLFAVFGGLVHRMPRYAFIFMFFTLASVGLPGLSAGS